MIHDPQLFCYYVDNGLPCELEEDHMIPKKYYEYYYTWSRAEKERKKHEKNGRKVCDYPMAHDDFKDNKKWRIWYNRIEDTKREGTSNAREYDK